MSTTHQRALTVAKVLVSVALICGAAFYLLGGSFRRSLVYDKTVDELAAEQTALRGQQVRVGGRLVSGSHQTPEGTTEHLFTLRGVDGTVAVRYRGLWPDAATEDRELMVEGRLDDDGVITAKRVLARCPSRYKRRVAQDGTVGPE